MTPKHLFNLPNDSTLKIAPPFAKGRQANWFMSHDKKAVWDCSDLAKGKNYRVNLWSSSTDLNILAADFDKLPSGFSNFDDLYSHFKGKFTQEQAVIARSASGKVKLFFLVQSDSINKSIAVDTLKSLFAYNGNLFSCLDTSINGLRITYLNRSVLTSLNSGVSKLKPITAIVKGSEFNTSRTQAPPYRIWKGSLDVIPKAKSFPVGKQELVRILLCSPQLISEAGFFLSTLKASRDLCLSQSLICRYRKQLEKLGWLEAMKGREYSRGKRAIGFKASGDLAVALDKLYPQSDTFRPMTPVLPTKIPDGEWNEKLGELTGKLLHLPLEQVLKQIDSIEGSNPERLKKAENWYKWHKDKQRVIDVGEYLTEMSQSGLTKDSELLSADSVKKANA